MMPSRIEAPLPVEAPERGITGVLDRLQAATLPLVDIEVADTRLVEGSTWEAVARFVLPGGQPLPLRIYDRATMRELFDLHVEFGRLPASVVDEVRACRRSVGVQAEIAGPGPLERYHAQLKVLAWLAPEAPAVLDVSAADARTATWLREVAESEVPPHPNALYTVHVVHDEDDVAWLHTHGLERCGRFELDMVDVPVEIAREMGMLLNATAHLLLDHGDPGRLV